MVVPQVPGIYLPVLRAFSLADVHGHLAMVSTQKRSRKNVKGNLKHLKETFSHYITLQLYRAAQHAGLLNHYRTCIILLKLEARRKQMGKR